MVKRNKKGQLEKGSVLNPEGRGIGVLDFKTKWYIFIEKVAAQNKITPEEVDEQMLAIAFKQIKEGNFQFYKDTQDRIHGQAKNVMDIKVELPVPILPIKNEIQPNNSDNKNNTDVKEVENLSRWNERKQDGEHNNILDSAKPVGQDANPDEHSVGELPTP